MQVDKNINHASNKFRVLGICCFNDASTVLSFLLFVLRESWQRYPDFSDAPGFWRPINGLRVSWEGKGYTVLLILMSYELVPGIHLLLGDSDYLISPLKVFTTLTLRVLLSVGGSLVIPQYLGF